MKRLFSIILFIAGAILIYWAWSGLGNNPPSNARMSSPMEPPDNTLKYLITAGGVAISLVLPAITQIQNVILNSHKIANEKSKSRRSRKK